MKNIYYIIVPLWFLYISHVGVYAATLKDKIIGDSGSGVIDTTSTATGEALLDSVLLFIRESIFGLLALVAIAVFLYIGAKLIMARGNPEEFKKALQSFIYAVIGIFVVTFAFALVRLIAGVNIGLA